MRNQQLRQQADNMQLLSIVRSEQNNFCMINDSILYEGDSIGDFRVGQIGDGFVKLESEGIKIILSLPE